MGSCICIYMGSYICIYIIYILLYLCIKSAHDAIITLTGHDAIITLTGPHWHDTDCVCVPLYTYIYIYIYSHLETECFVVSQLFSVPRLIGRLKLGSKPAQLYVRLRIRPLGQQAYHVILGILRYQVVAFVCLHFISYRIPECTIRLKTFELCEWQPKIPLPECSSPI